MAKKWIEVYNSPEYRGLSVEDRDAAREQYFSSVVQPQLKLEEIPKAREQFDKFHSELSTKEEQSSSFLQKIGKGIYGAITHPILDPTKRAVGVGFGVLNSPLAFVWGSQNARNLDPEQFDKMPFWKKQAVSIGGGLESAWRSISKKGDFGTMWGEYYEQTTGRTLVEDLPEGLKWAAPTIEALVNIGTDPLVTGGLIKGMKQLKVPEEFFTSMPKQMVDDLRKLEALEGEEKRQAIGEITKLLQSRKDYMQWWESKMPEVLERVPVIKRTAKEHAEALSGKLNRGQERTRLAGTPTLIDGKPLSRAERLTLKTSKQGFEKTAIDKIRGDVESGLVKRSGPDFLEAVTERLGGVVQDTPAKMRFFKEFNNWDVPKLNVPEELALLSKNPKQLAIIKQGFKDLGKVPTENQLIKSLVDDNAQGLRTAQGLFQRSGQIRKADPVGNRARAEELHAAGEDLYRSTMETFSAFLKLGDKRVEKFVRNELGEAYKNVPGVTARSTAGFALGVEVDEEGNVRYDPGKAMAGALVVGGIGGFKKGKKEYQKILDQNPAWAKVHNMVGQENKGLVSFAGMASKIANGFTEAQVKLFDRFVKIAKVAPKAYESARKYSSWKDITQLKFNTLVNGFSKVRDNEALVTDYILAHRALDRARNGIKNSNGVTGADAKMSIQEMEEYFVNQLGRDKSELQDALITFKSWGQKYILDEAVEAGLLSQNQSRIIKRKNEWYATFDVIEKLPPDVNKIPILNSREYFHVTNNKIIQKQIGTEKKIRNPLEATIKKFAQAQETYARNKIASMVVDETAGKGLVRPVAMNQKELALMQKQGLNPVMNNAWNGKEFGSLNRFKDGKLERYVAPIEVVESLKQLTPRQAPRWMQMVNNVFRKSATTVYVPFTISNAVRDGMMAYSTAPVFSAGRPDQFAKQWLKGFWEGGKFEFLGKSDLAENYIRSGGGFGYVGNLRTAKQSKQLLFKKGLVKKTADVVTSPVNLIEKISSTVELAPRLGTFEQGLKVGKTAEDAAMMPRPSHLHTPVQYP